jgi:hypothetical protein
MITLHTHKNHMQQLFQSLAEGWRGLFISGGTYTVAWISGQMALTIVQHLSLVLGIVIGVLTIIAQVQKQVDRYKSKHPKP